MHTALHGLAEHGQSPWMDQLSRELLRGGDLAALVDAGVLGVTSNPTIFQEAMSNGHAYDTSLVWVAMFKALIEAGYIPAVVLPKGHPTPHIFSLLNHYIPSESFSSEIAFK